MNESTDPSGLLDVVANALLWCFGLGIAVLLYWVSMLVVMGDLAYEVHSRVFAISREQFYASHYLAIIQAKLVVFLLFLLPYLGIKLSPRRGRQ